MKKYLFYTACVLFVVLTAISCDDDHKKDPVSGEKAKLVIASDFTVNNSPVSYLIPVGESLLDGGEVSMTNAVEVRANAYVESYKDWLFNVPAMNEATIRKYTRQADGGLLADGTLTCSSNAEALIPNIIVISDTKAYAAVTLEKKIIVFNPSDMTKKGEINLDQEAFRVNGSVPNPMGMVYRDGKVFVGCPALNNMPLCNEGAFVIVIDEATDTPEKLITDMRATSASFFNNEMFTDEKGDIYVACWASYGYIPGQKCGYLRIKKGETVFDPDYFFNITDMTIPQVEGGRLQYAVTTCYAENGTGYMFGFCPAYASDPIDWVNDKVICSFKIDLYNRTVTLLDLPRTNSYSCSISKLGDTILFGLTTTSNGAGLFSYNHKTGVTSKAPVVKCPGTVQDVAIFN